jgi:hypothetical protein
MSRRLTDIARRKQALIARCDRDREEVAELFNRVKLPVAAMTSIGLLLGKFLKAYPLLVTGITGWLVSRRVKVFARAIKTFRGMLRWWRAAYPLWSLWSKRRGLKQLRS